MSGSRYSLEHVEAVRRRRLQAEAVWFAIVAAFGLAALVFALASAGAVSPVYCGTCHGSQRAQLKATDHSTLTCDSCHTSPGAFGLLDNRIAVAGMVPAKLIPGVAGPRMPVANEACQRCHGDLSRQVVVRNGLRMSHREVTGEDWACTECHAGLAHKRSAAAPGGRYTMGMCLKCHSSNANNPDGCSVCHEGRADEARLADSTPWRVTHGAQWQSTHGMGELTTCKACHPVDYCSRCHGMTVPHPADFAARHGKAIVDDPSKRADCVVCHKGSACDDCHGIEMPHPRGFLQRHSSVVERSGRESCQRCHDELSCQRCHERHIHPGIPEGRLRGLRDRPVER